MALTSKSQKEWREIYTGFDTKSVGAGTLDPSIYASPEYAKKKTKKIMIGGLTLINYGSWDNDASPLALTIFYNPTYGAILAYNLHYVPVKVRQAMIQFIIKSNIKRIKQNKPIIVDYYNLKKAIPVSTKIVRLYKLPLIRVIQSYDLRNWGDVIKQNSKWSSHYKRSTGNESSIKKFMKSLRGFFS